MTSYEPDPPSKPTQQLGVPPIMVHPGCRAERHDRTVGAGPCRHRLRPRLPGHHRRRGIERAPLLLRRATESPRDPHRSRTTPRLLGDG